MIVLIKHKVLINLVCKKSIIMDLKKSLLEFTVNLLLYIYIYKTYNSFFLSLENLSFLFVDGKKFNKKKIIIINNNNENTPESFIFKALI